jgi:hypothetical protein
MAVDLAQVDLLYLPASGTEHIKEIKSRRHRNADARPVTGIAAALHHVVPALDDRRALLAPLRISRLFGFAQIAFNFRPIGAASHDPTLGEFADAVVLFKAGEVPEDVFDRHPINRRACRGDSRLTTTRKATVRQSKRRGGVRVIFSSCPLTERLLFEHDFPKTGLHFSGSVAKRHLTAGGPVCAESSRYAGRNCVTSPTSLTAGRGSI